MIYKYTVENGILEQRSLFQIPFKSANGYTVRIDDKILVNGLDYSIDGSRLWIERDIAGAVFSISDNVEDETNTLLTKISELELNINQLVEKMNSLEQTSSQQSKEITLMQGTISEKDIEYSAAFDKVYKQIEQNSSNINAVQDTVAEDISTVMDVISDTETSLTKKIEEVLNSATSDYEKVNKSLTVINENMASKKDITGLQKAVEALFLDISNAHMRINQLPESIEKAELLAVTEKLSSLKQSLAMEVAQRRRADTEIKLLLERVIEDMAKLEDIIIGNLGDDEIVTGILDKIKEEFNTSLDRLARITTANMTRAFKLKQVVSDIKGGDV